MPQETPRYAIRAKMDNDTPMEVLLPYVARAVAQIMDAGIIAEIPVVKGKPKREWMKDWAKIHDAGQTEAEVTKILKTYDEDTLRRVFNLALTVGANGVVQMNSTDFYIAMGNAAVNMLAKEGGEKEYIRSSIDTTDAK